MSNSKYKHGDKVVIVGCSWEPFWYANKIGEVFILDKIDRSSAQIFRDGSRGNNWFVTSKNGSYAGRVYEADFKLYEEKGMQLKQNWSISVKDKEQFDVYKATLLALGYKMNEDEGEYRASCCTIHHGGDDGQPYMWASMLEAYGFGGRHFCDIESFLCYHFDQPIDRVVAKIKALKETIAKAQTEIQELEETL